MRRPPFLCLFVFLFCSSVTQSRPSLMCDLEAFVKPAYVLPVTQTTVMKQYISYLLVSGLVTVANSTARNCSKLHELCAPLSNCLSKTALLLQRLKHRCQRPRCDSVFWESHSLMPPCGAVAFSSNATGKFTWNITLPSGMVFNISVWEVRSRVMPIGNMRNQPASVCSYAPHLRLEMNESVDGKPVRLYLCGKMPTQNIISDTEMVLSWENVIPHEEKSSFCFSYQPIAKRFYSVHSLAKPSAPCKRMDPRDSYKCKGLREWQNLNLREYYKDNTAHMIRLRDKLTMGNTQFTHLGSHTVSYFWLLTGTVANTPVLTILNCTSKRQKPTDAIDKVQLKLFSCPIAMHDDMSNMEQYLLGQPLHCFSDRSAGNTTTEYESKAGDLTIQMTALLSDQIDFYGDIFYRLLPCPGPHCDLSKYTIANKTRRISLSSLEPILQQRIMLLPGTYSSGLLMLSNLTVDFVAPTHPLCGWGGIYIYELLPLSLIAKICSPWVADAWNGSLQRQDGTSRLYFNDRPLLLIVKSYHPTSLILIELIVSLSQCAGFVNPAFQLLLENTYSVIPGICTVGFKRNSVSVSHHGCCQIQHLLMDGDYMYEDYYGSHYRSRIEGRTPTHTIGWIRNKVLTDRSYEALASFRERNSSWEMYCEPRGIKLNFPKLDPKKGGWVSFTPMLQYEYIMIFQAYCLVIGLGQVTILRYQDPPSEPVCLTPAEVEKDLPLYPKEHIDVPLLATTCGSFGYKEKMFTDDGQLSFLFNKPSITPLCCSLDLDMHIQTQHLPFVESLFLAEHILPTLNYVFPWPAASKWFCDDNDTCPDWDKVPGPTEIVRPLGRVWTTNSLLTRCVMLYVKRKPLPAVGNNYIINVSFVFSESDIPLYQREPNFPIEWHAWDHCFYEGSVCYKVYMVKKASWEEATRLCTINNSTLLSTPSDHEWQHVRYLFGKEVVLMNRVLLTMTSFINLRLLQAQTVSEKTKIFERLCGRWRPKTNEIACSMLYEYTNAYANIVYCIF